jgi:hypothetical protein
VLGTSAAQSCSARTLTRAEPRATTVPARAAASGTEARQRTASVSSACPRTPARHRDRADVIRSAGLPGAPPIAVTPGMTAGPLACRISPCGGPRARPWPQRHQDRRPRSTSTAGRTTHSPGTSAGRHRCGGSERLHACRRFRGAGRRKEDGATVAALRVQDQAASGHDDRLEDEQPETESVRVVAAAARPGKADGAQPGGGAAPRQAPGGEQIAERAAPVDVPDGHGIASRTMVSKLWTRRGFTVRAQPFQPGCGAFFGQAQGVADGGT